MKTQNNSALILIILISVTIFGCETGNSVKTVRVPKGDMAVGGTLRVPLLSLPDQVSPSSLSGASSTTVGVHLHECLVRLDSETAELIPAIAESWSVDEEGVSYVFNLRKGVSFHASNWFGNGSREVTAEDVAYSFKTLAKSASQELFEFTLGGRVKGAESFRDGGEMELVGVEILDDYTVRIKLEKADEPFLRILTLPAFGIIPNKSAEADEPVKSSSGPFMLADRESGFTLIRNPDYYAKDEFGNRLPYIDTLIFVEMKQNSDRLNAIFEDQIDLVSNLELDPVRGLLEQHVSEFSGKTPKYVLKREVDNASYDTYTVYHTKLKNLGSGFMGYRDFRRVQIEQ